MTHEIKVATLRSILAMMECSSDDPTRYHIGGVHIAPTGGKVKLSATNGHMLVTRELTDTLPGGPWIIHRDEAKVLKLVLDEHKSIQTTEARIVDGHLEIGRFTKMSIPRAESYPDIAQVIPRQFKTEVAIAFCPEYLVRMARAMEAGKMKPVCISFDPTSPNAPMRIYAGEGDYAAVLMPCRDPYSARVGSEVGHRLSASEGLSVPASVIQLGHRA